MQSVFRIYAKTNKTMDPYLYKQLLSMGLKPKHEDLLHSFYFNANFNDLFKLSFYSLTVQNMYLQIGQKIPMYSRYFKSGRTAQQQFGEYLKKINFKGYMNMQRGLIERITMNLLIRQSSTNLPSQNAILGILKNHLMKQSIMKQYRQMLASDQIQKQQLQNYYDIKMLISRKWDHQDKIGELEKEKLLLMGNQSKYLLKGKTEKQALVVSNTQKKQLQQLRNVSYDPHLIFYVRRNHGRFLLKINKESLYKHGWKKHVGWGPMRETLAASVLYRAGFIQRIKKQKKQLKLWDPFCGSSTIPLVAFAMFSSLAVRQDHVNNFVWQHWPIFKQQYLNTFFKTVEQQNNQSSCKLFGSDNSMQMVKYSVENFNKLLDSHQVPQNRNDNQTNFLDLKPSDQIYQVLKNSIYVGFGDFEDLASSIATNKDKKVTIATNLPYLNQRSKQHHQLNQLTSIYRRFSQMIEKYQDGIQNVFVLIDKDGIYRNSHFLKVSTVQWRILHTFNNGGIQVMLLGWAGNVDGWESLDLMNIPTTQNKSLQQYKQQKKGLLDEYRVQIKQAQKKQHMLPKYLADPSKYRGYRKTLEQRKARHLRAAYQIFAKRKQGNQIYSSYARKQLALRLSRRGAVWKKKNMSIIGARLEDIKQDLKQKFESTIQKALERSEKMKEIKKKKTDGNKAKKIW